MTTCNKDQWLKVTRFGILNGDRNPLVHCSASQKLFFALKEYNAALDQEGSTSMSDRATRWLLAVALESTRILGRPVRAVSPGWLVFDGVMR